MKIIIFLILMIALVGCDQPNVNVDIGGGSPNPPEQPVGGGCGVAGVETNQQLSDQSTEEAHYLPF